MPDINTLWDEIAMIIGVVLLVGSERAFRKTRAFVARCRSATGTVVGHTEEDDDGGISYFSIIRFADSSGMSHDLTGPGSRQPPKVGLRVAISYDPADPGNAWRSKTGAPWVIPWVMRIAAISALVCGVLLRWA